MSKTIPKPHFANSTFRSFNVFLLVSASLLVGCGKKQASEFARPVSEAEAIETQRQVDRFFHKDVIPRLEQGWKELQDSGKSVTYHYRYARNGDRWEFKEMEKVESTLSGPADAAAQVLMEGAVAGTYFPVEKRMEKDAVLDLYWTWPVPFPEGAFDPATGEFTAARRAGTNTGGCDGRGTRAHCNVCSQKLDCLLVCVGAAECSRDDRSCWELYQCASGGPFGVLSGNVIR